MEMKKSKYGNGRPFSATVCFPGVARNGNGVCPRIPIILQGKKEIKNRTADYITF